MSSTRLRGWLAGFFLIVVNSGLFAQDDSPRPAERKFDSAWLGTFSFRPIGPALMSGRIADIAIAPDQPNTWYLGVGSGGVWKTTNSGTTWNPIFDNQASYSIGCVTVDPTQSHCVWIGTGENVGGRHVGVGDGVYRSADGGKTWENKGLKSSEHISKIWVDPRDSNVVLVAAQGPLWSPGGERGVYKSVDGGNSWKQVLSKGEYTGATDLAVDPANPDIVYAALHQRHRTVWALLNTGPESGIYKSTDGGETWLELTQGLPGEDKGKIALGVSPFKSNRVYASIELPNRQGGFWRSDDAGASWTRVSDFVSGGTGPHYYQEIYLDPHREDVIYHANVVLMRSLDGGTTWDVIEGGTKHVDNHAVAFHPLDADHLLVATDGGLYESHDWARTFRFFPNLPLTQFYKIDVDYDFPFYNVIGGTQDNFTQYGPTRTRFVQGIRNSDWRQVVGGDGHDNAIDPSNPNLLYGESQEGFLRRIDRQSDESVDIQPQPAAGEDALRFNWDSPILISPHHSSRLYFGSRKLHRSDDRGDSWQTISPDLSRAQNRWTLPIMRRVWGIDAGFDLLAMSQFGNITSISESPLVEGLIYAGTDDGLVHVTEDGGQSWRRFEKFYGVPEQAFVNDIKADRHHPDTVYVCLDHHKTGDFKPYVLRSRDRGKTWESIASDLPDRHLVWRLEQDPVRPELLFLGTEYGVFLSLDAGQHWHKLSAGLPTISVRDLAIQKRENDLVIATFGRGLYVLDDYSPLREMVNAEFSEREGHLFPLRKTLWYQPADELGGERGFQGDELFLAPNPPFGAAFTLYLKTATLSKKAQRQEQEQSARKEQKDVPVPDWDSLRVEQDEEPERTYLEIRDTSDRLLRRLDCPASAGIHRLTWDLQYVLPGTSVSILAAPGTYRAQIRRWTAGELKTLCEPVEFTVESIVKPALAGPPRTEVIPFLEQAAKSQMALAEQSSRMARLQAEITGRQELVAQHATDLQSLSTLARSVELKLNDFNRRMVGDPVLQLRYVRTAPAIVARISQVVFSAAGTLYGPTKTHRDQLAIGIAELEKLKADIDQLDNGEFAELRNRMNSAGLSWFPPAPPIPFDPQD